MGVSESKAVNGAHSVLLARDALAFQVVEDCTDSGMGMSEDELASLTT
jgi:hypothetical protein